MLPRAHGSTGLSNDAGLSELPFTLASLASLTVDLVGRSLFLDNGPAASGSLGLRLDDDQPEIDIHAGHYMAGRPFRRVTLRNKTAAPLTGHLLYSVNPDFLALQPGGGSGGASLTDDTLWSKLVHGNYRIRPFDSLPATIHAGAGSAATLTPIELFLDSGAGALKDRWMGELDPLNAFDGSGSVAAAWLRQHRHRCLLMVNLLSGGTLNDWAGIGIGGYAGAPPYPTVGAGVVNCALLYCRANGPAWELYVGRQASKAAKIPLVGVTVPTIGFFDTFDLELRYYPGSRVEAYVNGVLGATQADPTVLPDTTQFMSPFATYFVTTGAVVGSDSQATFMESIAAMYGFPGVV